MREYKFRAWDKNGKKLFKIFDSVENEEWFLPNWKTRYIVTQYTGILDRNGKEIYEGDVIRYPAENAWEKENFISYTVWFDNRIEWGIGYKLKAKFHGVLCGGYVESNLKNANKMQKIGNIFENSVEEGQE